MSVTDDSGSRPIHSTYIHIAKRLESQIERCGDPGQDEDHAAVEGCPGTLDIGDNVTLEPQEKVLPLPIEVCGNGGTLAP